MAGRANFMSLPAELRERVYEYIALSHPTRRVQAIHDGVDSWRYKATTSAIAGTCRLIRNEYEDIAGKTITKLDFTAVDLDVRHIVNYFQTQVDAKYLASLQQNHAMVQVKLVVHDDRACEWELGEFYRWALFLVNVKLEASYWASLPAWITMHVASEINTQLVDHCVSGSNRTQAIQDNIEEIHKKAQVFQSSLWAAYAPNVDEIQIYYHREGRQEYRQRHGGYTPQRAREFGYVIM